MLKIVSAPLSAGTEKDVEMSGDSSRSVSWSSWIFRLIIGRTIEDLKVLSEGLY